MSFAPHGAWWTRRLQEELSATPRGNRSSGFFTLGGLPVILEGNQAIVCDLAAIYLELILQFPVISVRKRLWFSQLLSAHPASPSVP